MLARGEGLILTQDGARLRIALVTSAVLQRPGCLSVYSQKVIFNVGQDCEVLAVSIIRRNV